jgi:hypothetical protein
METFHWSAAEPDTILLIFSLIVTVIKKLVTYLLPVIANCYCYLLAKMSCLQISSANTFCKSQIRQFSELKFFVRFADLPQMWQFADL